MSEITQHDTNFVGYEYKDMLVRRSMESVFADGYGNFGWTLDSVSSSIPSHSSVIMKFKRDRKIRNKNELTRLQRQFESCVAEIERLEKSKVIGAGVVAYTLGVSGTACMASAVFSYLGGMLPLFIVLAVLGFIGWTFPYLCFTSIRKKKTAEVDPFIDKKYDEIYAVCEKANALLAH